MAKNQKEPNSKVEKDSILSDINIRNFRHLKALLIKQNR